MDAQGPLVKHCPLCDSTVIKLYDPGLREYKPGTEIGVVYGEHITGSFSWDDTCVPFQCGNSHLFYVSSES